MMNKKLFTRLLKNVLRKIGYINIKSIKLNDIANSKIQYKVNRSVINRIELSYDSKEKLIEMYGRYALPFIAHEGAICLELGVAQGYYSDLILSYNRVGKLFSIDRWSDHHDSEEYLICCSRLSDYGTRSVVLRQSFEEIKNIFSDDLFDFIYIDAYAADGQDNGRILYDWYSKLKVGGIFSGHDYDPIEWPKTYNAVNDFADFYKLEVKIVPGYKTANPQDLFPSWYIVKR